MHTLTPKFELLIFVVIYMIIMAGVGIYFSGKKHMKNSDDFVLAGRGLGSIVLCGTLLATFTGGGAVTGGATSLAYNFGLWPGIFFVLPFLLGILVLFALTKKIREKNCYTVAELLEKTYGPVARIFSAIIIALALISITSYQYRGLALVVNATTGIDPATATIVCAALVIVLAFSGGLKSVAVTDAISAFLMVFGLALALPFLLKQVGGWSWVVENAPPESLTLTGGQSFLGFVSAYFPLFFLAMGDQNLYQRIAAGKGLKEVRSSMIGWFIGMLIVIPVIAVIAFIGRLYFGSNIPAGQALIATSTITSLFIGGIMLSAASAFMVTTADSYLLSASTNITYDIYNNRINPNATDAQKFRITRGCIIVLGVLSFVILQFFPSILAIQYWAYTIYGAGITPALLAALIWPRVTKAGGLASMATGTVVTIGWELAGLPLGLLSVLVALPASVLVLIIVSLCTKNKAKVAV